MQSQSQNQNQNQIQIPVITLPMLLAANSTIEANKLVDSYGLRHRNQAELINSLSSLLKRNDDKVIKQMAEIHPHKGFIIETLGTKIIGQEAADMEKESNEPRCPGKGIKLQNQENTQTMMTDQEIKEKMEKSMKEVVEKSSNLDGDKYKVSPKEWIPVVAVAGAALVVLAVIFKMK